MVRARDIATVRMTQKDPTTITRLNGKPAVAIEISKRTGANLIETVDTVKVVTEAFAKLDCPRGPWSPSARTSRTTSASSCRDLQNSVLTAVILVFIVILFALSGRASLLIGLAIPASFLMGILGLDMAGLTVNIVVLFSLILAVGMLVDDAIIVTEFAERRMSEGMDKREAFAMASPPHGGPGDRRHHDPGRGLLAAAVLARHRRRVHEIHADHADRHAVGLDALCADLRAHPRRAHRPAGEGGRSSIATGSTCGSSDGRSATPGW